MLDRPSADLLETLGRKVRAARLQLGLPIEELADLAHLDVLTLDAIERGEDGRLTMARLAELAEALDVQSSDLTADPPQR